MPPRAASSGFASRRGSVIIFVLGIILLAAFLITRLMDRAAVELAAESKAAKRADLRQEAFSALEAALAVLADEAAAGDGLHDATEGWDHPLALMAYQPSPGYTAEVTVADETGKLSLPQADEDKLEAYLQAIGCPATAADRVLDALLAWTRPDHVPLDRGSLEFTAAALPYEAPQRALRSFEELRAIPAVREQFFDEQGRWNELGQRFKAGASLYSFNNTNINAAGADALFAQGLDQARISAIEAARREQAAGRTVYRTAAELAGAWGRDGAPPGLGTEAQCLQVTVKVRFGGLDYRIDVWVGRPGAVGGAAGTPRAARRNAEAPAATPEVASVRNNPRKRLDYPFQILELRENDGS